MGRSRLNLFATLGRNRRMFRGWLHLVAVTMPTGALCRKDTEAIILRVAAVRGSAYELDHHRRLGRGAGLSDDEITALTDPGGPVGGGGRPALLAVAADDYLADRRISDEAWSALAAVYDVPQLLEITMLLGFYDSLAATLDVLRVRVDV